MMTIVTMTDIAGHGEAVSAEYLYALIKSSIGAELPIDTLLAGSGVDANSFIKGIKEVGHLSFRIVISNLLEYTSLEELTSQFLNYLGNLDHGPASIAIQSSKTLAGALHILAHVAETRTAGKRFAVIKQKKHYYLIMESFAVPLVVDEEVDKFIVMSSLLGVAKIIQPQLRPLCDITRVSFEFSVNQPDRLYQNFASKGIEIQFECEKSSLSWHENCVWQPGLSNKKLVRFAVNECDKEKSKAKSYDVIESRVRFELSSSTQPTLTIETVAEAINMSSRNLQRKLKNAGTSFREIRSSKVLKRAHQYLVHTDLSVESISTALGYSHSSNFIKAFKNYYGLLPSGIRDNKK